MPNSHPGSPTEDAIAVVVRVRFVLGLALVALVAAGACAFDYTERPPAPAFTHVTAEAWLNSEPLTLTELKGRVVLLDVWTYDCWNCYRSFPWLNTLERTFAADPFTVIGVHTPEFAHERARGSVAQKIVEFELRHPVMIDNDYSYWKALRNRYWPTFYLIDKRGRLVKRFIGETRAGAERAATIEAAVRTLLAESH